MIVRDRPNAFALLITLRGSIVPEILPHLVLVALFTVLLTLASRYQVVDISSLTVMPITLLGIVLSILLSFRNNAAYDRWWEARKLWGQMVHEIRSFARASKALLDDAGEEREAMLGLLLGYAHALRGQLRQESVKEALLRWSDRDRVEQALSHHNVPDWFLRKLGDGLGDCYRRGQLDSVGLTLLDERVSALAAIQAGCERLASTPIPFAYTLLVHRTAYGYCYLLPFALVGAVGWAAPVCVAAVAYTFFGVDRLAEHLETPFGRAANDLPLDALCRIHEISVAESLGRTPPPPLPVKDHLLQ
ncbi:MAG: bestrophin family ion channel [Pseudomonadota bacterium]|nr:bestrophin family ion channel [Pseudomonadota bacterium]